MGGSQTAQGYRVELTLSSEQAEQLERLLDMAKMIDGRRIDGQVSNERRSDTMDVIGYRAFLEEMLVLIRDAIAEKQSA